MTTPPHITPKAPKVALIPAPITPMKAKNDRPQMNNVSFSSMSTAYAKGR